MKNGWRECQLGDVINLKRGYDLPKRKRVQGHVPIISSSGITDHHNEAKVKGPGVVTGRYGTLGQIFYVEGEYWPLNTSLYVQDFKGNYPRFISFFLRTLSFGAQNAAGAVPGVNRNHLHKLEVKIPDLPTQRKIAGILSAYDDLIENNLRRIRILEEMAQSLYREWFIHFRYPKNEPSPPAPLPRGEGSKKTKGSSPSGRGGGEGRVKLVDSPLGPIPEGWEVKKLGDLAEDLRRSIPKGDLGEPTPYVGLEHIPRKSLALDDWEVVSELGSNKLLFEPDEVLFGKIRPYFHKVSVAPFPGICSADTIVIRSKDPEDRALVTACVSSDAFVAYASATANGAKMPRANWKVLVEYLLVNPPADIKARFSEFYTNTIDKQKNLIRRNQTLRRTRDLLLPKLLSGGSDS